MAAALQRSMLYKVLPLGGIESPRVAASEDLQVRQRMASYPLLQSTPVPPFQCPTVGKGGGWREESAQRRFVTCVHEGWVTIVVGQSSTGRVVFALRRYAAVSSTPTKAAAAPASTFQSRHWVQHSRRRGTSHCCCCIPGSGQTAGQTAKWQQLAGGEPAFRWLQAVVAQVRGDAALLRSRVVQLRGAAGGARFDAALAAVTAEEAAAFGDVPAAVQVQHMRSCKRQMLRQYQ
jgi:hypothetical protein